MCISETKEHPHLRISHPAGQIAKMLKPAQTKSEVEGGKPVAVVYATGSPARNSGNASGIGNVGRMGAFSQMVSLKRCLKFRRANGQSVNQQGSSNQGQFIRLQDNGLSIPKTEGRTPGPRRSSSSSTSISKYMYPSS